MLWIKQESLTGTIDFKELEKVRGYLIHIVGTYPQLTPYLKGIHQMLDSWRPWRDTDGWKLCMNQINIANGLAVHPTNEHDQVPKRVKVAPRLAADVEVLLELTASDKAPRRLVRASRTASVIYSGGDASGQGFRAIHDDGKEIKTTFGEWCMFVREENTSNYNELSNLVERLETLKKRGSLKNVEMFLFTDNMVTEYAYYKGNSSKKLLFGLIVRLYKLSMYGELILHVIWIPGTRMIECGIDGLSRGTINQGVLARKDTRLMDYIPLHLGAVERSEDLHRWIQSW